MAPRFFGIHLVHQSDDPNLNIVPFIPLREEMKAYRRASLDVEPGVNEADRFRVYPPVPDLMPVKCF